MTLTVSWSIGPLARTWNLSVPGTAALESVPALAAVGAAIVGVGWATVVSPAVANAQLLPIPQANDITCPHIAGIQYLPDPDNSNAYYVCADGVQQDHNECPPDAHLDMDQTPPECLSLPKGYEGKP
jgi:hypothetical protein